MPSAQKQQQQTVVKNGTTTTTTTVITNQSAFDNTKFTQAELGARSFARTVEKNIAEMNKKKSGVASLPLPEPILRGVATIPDDLSFGSTSELNQLPQRVIDILSFHGISFAEGDRIIHIPGAKYFSISKMEGDIKTYRTFSLDEDITPHKSEPEIETEVEVEIQEESDSATSENLEPVRETDESVTVIESNPVSQESIPAVSINTLGTIHVSPNTKNELPINPPPVSESLESQPVLAESFPEKLSTASVDEPVEDLNVSQSINQTEKKIAPETDLEKKLDLARTASNRERDAYYANRYVSSITGTISELFGNSLSIHSELFKTIQDYDTARRSVLLEMGTQKKSFHEVVSWVKQEQFKIAHLFSHNKNQSFIKLAQVFGLSVPSVIETRTGAGPVAVHTTISTVGKRLGFTLPTNTTPSWSYLFTTDRPVKLDLTKKIQPVTHNVTPVIVSPLPEPLPVKEPEVITMKPLQELVFEDSLPEKKVSKKELYTKLYNVLTESWGIKKDVPQKIDPVEQIVREDVSSLQQDHSTEGIFSDKIIEDIVPQKPIDQPMPTISFEPVLVETSPAVAQMSSPMKQHPEALFS